MMCQKRNGCIRSIERESSQQEECWGREDRVSNWDRRRVWDKELYWEYPKELVRQRNLLKWFLLIQVCKPNQINRINIDSELHVFSHGGKISDWKLVFRSNCQAEQYLLSIVCWLDKSLQICAEPEYHIKVNSHTNLDRAVQLWRTCLLKSTSTWK